MKKTNKSKRALILSCAVLLLIIIASLLAPLSPYDPNAINTLEKFLSPSAAHWLGTDNFGRSSPSSSARSTASSAACRARSWTAS